MQVCTYMCMYVCMYKGRTEIFLRGMREAEETWQRYANMYLIWDMRGGQRPPLAVSRKVRNLF